MKRYSYLKKPVSLKKIRIYNDLSKKENLTLKSSSSFSTRSNFLAVKSSFLQNVINFNLFNGDNLLMLRGGYTSVSTTTMKIGSNDSIPFVIEPNFVHLIDKKYYDLGTIKFTSTSRDVLVFVPLLLSGCAVLTHNTIFPYVCLFKFLVFCKFTIFIEKNDVQPIV